MLVNVVKHARFKLKNVLPAVLLHFWNQGIRIFQSVASWATVKYKSCRVFFLSVVSQTQHSLYLNLTKTLILFHRDFLSAQRALQNSGQYSPETPFFVQVPKPTSSSRQPKNRAHSDCSSTWLPLETNMNACLAIPPQRSASETVQLREALRKIFPDYEQRQKIDQILADHPFMRDLNALSAMVLDWIPCRVFISQLIWLTMNVNVKKNVALLLCEYSEPNFICINKSIFVYVLLLIDASFW